MTDPSEGVRKMESALLETLALIPLDWDEIDIFGKLKLRTLIQFKSASPEMLMQISNVENGVSPFVLTNMVKLQQWVWYQEWYTFINLSTEKKILWKEFRTEDT